MSLAFWICLIRHSANMQCAAIPVGTISMCNPNTRLMNENANIHALPTPSRLLDLGKRCPEGMAMVVGIVASSTLLDHKQESNESTMHRVRDVLRVYDVALSSLTLVEREAAWSPTVPIEAPQLTEPTEIPGEAYTMEQLRADLGELSKAPGIELTDAEHDERSLLTASDRAAIDSAKARVRSWTDAAAPGFITAEGRATVAGEIDALLSIIGRLSG